MFARKKDLVRLTGRRVVKILIVRYFLSRFDVRRECDRGID